MLLTCKMQRAAPCSTLAAALHQPDWVQHLLTRLRCLQEANPTAAELALFMYRDEVRRQLLKHDGYECAVRGLCYFSLAFSCSLALPLALLALKQLDCLHPMCRTHRCACCAGELVRIHAGLQLSAVCALLLL